MFVALLHSLQIRDTSIASLRLFAHTYIPVEPQCLWLITFATEKRCEHRISTPVYSHLHTRRATMFVAHYIHCKRRDASIASLRLFAHTYIPVRSIFIY
ncbi:MAG: hypothetical protein IKM10_04020 [Bacteroidaceae bacterium]|nr:hypothetical protein [Bacteroidaceae bacterium]